MTFEAVEGFRIGRWPPLKLLTQHRPDRGAL
jgi:hypothetical protein